MKSRVAPLGMTEFAMPRTAGASGRNDDLELGTVGAEVAVVAGDFPEEENVFGFGALADVVDDLVAAGRRLFVNDYADVGDVAA